MCSIIFLSDYQVSWALDFKREAQLIRETLSCVSLIFHHVGSTAVPGIKSKPIIDINIESNEFPPGPMINDKLGGIGYVNRGEAGVAGRHWFVKGDPRKYHLHWCPHNGEVTLAQTNFRDRLRADKAMASEYEKVKLDAAMGRSIDSPDYAIAKSTFVCKALQSR